MKRSFSIFFSLLMVVFVCLAGCKAQGERTPPSISTSPAAAATTISSSPSAVASQAVPTPPVVLPSPPASPTPNPADRAWQEADKLHSESSFLAFAEKYPHDPRAARAKASAGRLGWQRAHSAGTAEGYQSFLDHYPDDPQAAVVRQVLQEQDVTLTEALKRGWVSTNISGAGLESVSFTIKRLVPRPLRVSLPAGSYFVSGGAAQNMLSREGAVADLTSSTSTSLDVAASCANFYRDMPGSGDGFDVRSAHPDSDLQKVMCVIGKQHPGVLVSQLAIWSITDDPAAGEIGEHINVTPSQEDFREAAQLLRAAGIKPSSRRMFQGL